jgi:hypothetical protein
MRRTQQGKCSQRVKTIHKGLWPPYTELGGGIRTPVPAPSVRDTSNLPTTQPCAQLEIPQKTQLSATQSKHQDVSDPSTDNPQAKPQNSRCQYDPLRPLQSSERIAIPTPQPFMLLISTTSNHLWLEHTVLTTPWGPPPRKKKKKPKAEGTSPRNRSRSRSESRLHTDLSDAYKFT